MRMNYLIILAVLVLLSLTVLSAGLIWAINVLAAAGGADFAIPYTAHTLLAGVVIGGFVAASARGSK